MNEEKFNMSMRKLLKQVGVTSQQEIEKAVRASDRTEGRIALRVVVTSPDLGLEHVVEGDIELS